MKLNIHSRPAKLYRAFYNKDVLPNNLCNYFWALVIALISIPFVYPVLVLNACFRPIRYDLERKEYVGNYGRIPAFVGIIFNLCFCLLGLVTCDVVYGREMIPYIPVWKFYVNGIGVAAAIVLGIIGIIYGAVFISSLIPEKKSDGPEVLKTKEYWDAIDEKKKQRQARKERSFWYLLMKQFKAWKDRNCPIIEWTHEK